MSETGTAAIGFILFNLGSVYAAYRFQHGRLADRYAKPSIIYRLGAVGDLVERLLLFVTMICGISLVIWSFWKLSWYVPILLYLGSLFALNVLVRVPNIGGVIASVPALMVAAVGLAVLQWFTWMA